MTTNLRLPPDLHEQVKRVAEREERSMNAQFVVFLREALERYLAEHPERWRGDANR